MKGRDAVMGESIVVTSGKGGVGKTTICANIGCGLAQLGKKVVMIDTDIGLRNLDVIMGMENRIVYNLVDVIEKSCTVKQALVRDKNNPELYLLASAQTRDKSSITPEQMKELATRLTEDFDYVLLDCPAGIEQGFRNAVSGAQRAIVVTTPEVSSIRDADRVIGLLEIRGMGKIDLVLNRIRPHLAAKGDMMSIDDISEILAPSIIGAIAYDEELVVCSNRGESVVGRDTVTGRALMDLCKRITGEEIPLSLPKEKDGILSKLKAFFKKH